MSPSRRWIAVALGALTVLLALTLRAGRTHAATTSTAPARAQRLACGESERVMAPPAVRLDGARAHGRSAALLGPVLPPRVEKIHAPSPVPSLMPPAPVSRSRARALLMVFLN